MPLRVKTLYSLDEDHLFLCIQVMSIACWGGGRQTCDKMLLSKHKASKVEVSAILSCVTLKQ